MIFSFYFMNRQWIVIMNTVHIIVTDFFIFFLNLIFDLCLVVHIRKELSKKKKLILKSSSKKGQAKKLKEIKKAHDDTNKMVILSLSLYILSRLPELIFEMHLFIRYEKTTIYAYEYICLVDGFCYLIKDFTRFLYIITYCLNIILYYKYNRNFRLGFRNFFRLKIQADD